MAPYRYARRVSYDEFVARVRRHRPSELLPAIALTALAKADQEAYLRDGYRVETPWALAAAAKESILRGNEHRPAGVTDRDVLEICAAFAALDDPLARGDGSFATTVPSFFTRMTNEQFAFQMSPFEEISRVQALFGTGLDAVETEVLSDSSLAEVMGCGVLDYLGVGFLLAVSAQQNEGYFDPAWIDRPNFELIRREIPGPTLWAMFYRHFTVDFPGFRAMAESVPGAPVPTLRRYEFNPLVARPFIGMVDGRYLAPQPAYVFQKLSPAAIYYLGIERFGEPFARDVGNVFQAYVGRQLAQFPDAVVHPEVHYDNDQRSVDWFVVWDEAVVLVEVKSTRLTQGARMGLDKLTGDLDRAIGRAYRQIDRTARLMEEGHPAFGHIPRNRPLVGLVVTLEPIWMVNSPWIKGLMSIPPPRIPVITAASRELELLVTVGLQSGTGACLLNILNDAERRTWNLGNAIGERPARKNPILQEAWDLLPFKEEPDAST